MHLETRSVVGVGPCYSGIREKLAYVEHCGLEGANLGDKLFLTAFDMKQNIVMKFRTLDDAKKEGGLKINPKVAAIAPPAHLTPHF